MRQTHGNPTFSPRPYRRQVPDMAFGNHSIICTLSYGLFRRPVHSRVSFVQS